MNRALAGNAKCTIIFSPAPLSSWTFYERQKKRTLVTPIINNESPYYYAKKARIYRTNLNCHNHGDLYCCLATELRLMNHVNHPRLLYV